MKDEFEEGRLNTFNQYVSKSAAHEDRLTRALLVTIRLSPVAFDAFYRLLTKDLADLIPPIGGALNLLGIEFDTQVGKLPDDAAKYFSVLITNDDHKPDSNVSRLGRMDRAGKNARYDGVITVGKEAIFFIEVKPANRNIGDWQLSPAKGDVPDEAYLHERVTTIPMKDIIREFKGIIKRDNTGHSEKLVIEDFMVFVDTHYDELNPFDNFDWCNTVHLTERRTKSILEEIAVDSESVKWDKNWGWTIDFNKCGIWEIVKVGLIVKGVSESTGDWSGLELAFNFGSTTSQAKSFYLNENVTWERLESIVSTNNATLTGDLHLAKASTNKFWLYAKPTMVQSYFQYWKGHTKSNNRIRQIRRPSYATYLNEVLAQGFMSGGTKLVEKTDQSPYNSLNVCPAIDIKITYSKEEVVAFDLEGELAMALNTKIREVLAFVSPDPKIIDSIFNSV